MDVFLNTHWLALVFLAASLFAGGTFLWRWHKGAWSLTALLSAASFFLLSLGGLELAPAEWSLWIAAGAGGALVLLLAIVIISGHWWPIAGYGVAAVLLFGLGGVIAEPGTWALTMAGKFLYSLEPLQPWWLLLLVFVPVVIWLSFRSLSGLGPVRRVMAIGLRCLLLILLTLALAETHARRPDENTTVLFAWDRSLSIPQEVGRSGSGQMVDLRDERIRKFIKDAVENRGPGRTSDKSGLIVFGRYPRLELPPAAVPQLRLGKIASTIDDSYTDIASSIKLALASFPEGTGKRIVLISDGNQNLGNAEEQARIAKQNGVQIDVVAVASGRQAQNEVLVERVEAPTLTEKDSRVPIRIVLRSYHPQPIWGTLTLTKRSLEFKQPGKDGKEQAFFEEQPILQTDLQLRYGVQVYYFQQPGSTKDDAFTYEAKFVPRQGMLPGDRRENNQASANVMARGQRAVLLIEPTAGEHKLLVDRLQKTKTSLKVVAVEPGRLPQDPAQLALVLSKFDSVILANLPAESLTEEQQKVIRSNTHDQGAGLIMIGGPNSFGSGGWQNTEIEKALPVVCDLKSVKIEGKSGLVLIMHASEMAEGNAWQKKIAKLSIEKLSPMDMCGMIYWDWQGRGAGGNNGHVWHIPFTQIGPSRGKMLGLVDSMVPGDMPDVDPALKMARIALTNPAHNLGTKHCIFISDGDHWDASRALLAQFKQSKISITTVCITTHGKAEIDKMGLVAILTGGRPYHIKDPSELPAIYIKETRLVSQSFVYDKKFQPELLAKMGPTEGINEVDPLYGFVRTTRRNSPLVEVSIQSPKTKEIGDIKFPILATWHYGLGKAVAFTSDARSVPNGPQFWDRDWASGNIYAKFWEQTVDWSLRSVESGKHLYLNTEIRDGKVRIIVEANDDDPARTPITNLEIKAGLTSPSLKIDESRRTPLKFEQKNSGVYEAELKAEDSGSYFFNIAAKWTKDGKEYTDTVRAGVTIPYSPEFSEMESNVPLLERLAHITGGKLYSEDEASLARVVQSGDVFRPLPVSFHSLQTIWFWLVVLAGICLFFDVAVRRIAIDTHKLAYATVAFWDRLRGRAPLPEATVQFLDRLKSRKAEVGESFDKTKAARRFDGEEGPVSAPQGATVGDMPSTPPTRRPVPAQSSAPEQEKEPSDFAGRLMKAKKKAIEDRDKGKPGGTS